MRSATILLLVTVVTPSIRAQDFVTPPVYRPIETSPVRLEPPVATADPAKPSAEPEPSVQPQPRPANGSDTTGTVRRDPDPKTNPEPTPTPKRSVDPLDLLVDRAITDTRQRLLTASRPRGTRSRTPLHTPWQIAHGILALRDEYEVVVDGRRVNAIQWIATNPEHDGKKWFLRTRFGGKGQPFTEPYIFEGHPNQFLAFFATAGLPEDFRFGTGDESFTIKQWIRHAQMEINPREEITWTLWAFSTYLPPDARWVDQHNRGWSIEKLVRMQIEVPPQKAACGGMHGLFATANALNAQAETGEPKRGVWLEADQYVKRHAAAVESMQNRDGSFSSNYLKGREWSRDPDRRISTTGHTLEFLMNALPDSELRSTWVRRAVERVARDLSNNKTRQLEPGGMYHACDALVIYRQRTRPEFRSRREPPVLAEQPSEPASKPSPENLPPRPTPARPAGEPATFLPAPEAKPIGEGTDPFELPVKVVPTEASSRRDDETEADEPGTISPVETELDSVPEPPPSPNE